MEKSYLEKTEEKFYESLETITKPEERFKRYGDFWEWLKYQEAEEVKEVKARLIYSVVKWLIKTDAIVKNFTSNWNPRLVKRTGTFIEKWKKSIGNFEIPNEEQISLFDRILNESDFATMAYCCQMLQRDGVVDFSSLYKPSVREKHEFIETPIAEGIKRPGIFKPYILDNGMKYYHPDTKELMTYDECTEKGLGRHLLMYPPGHEQQKTYVGFHEPDASKISTEFDEKTEEFLETVFIDGEKLFKDDQ